MDFEEEKPGGSGILAVFEGGRGGAEFMFIAHCGGGGGALLAILVTSGWADRNSYSLTVAMLLVG